MVKGSISDIHKKIIQQLSKLQIESLMRIATGNTEIDLELRLIGVDCTKSDIDFVLSSALEVYDNLHSNPELINTLDADGISNLKDLLCNYEEEFRHFGVELPKFWHKLFLISFIHEHLN